MTVDLNRQTLESHGRVEGTMQLGHFSGDHLAADLEARKVALQGNARLHIVQGGLK